MALWQKLSAIALSDMQSKRTGNKPTSAADLRVDFVVPRAHKGKKNPDNLVACCAPCNTIKGTHVYANFDEAKVHVLARREELRSAWQEKTARRKAKSASA
jgi:5-methylcytosine-specific restriction endonuclease McrA